MKPPLTYRDRVIYRRAVKGAATIWPVIPQPYLGKRHPKFPHERDRLHLGKRHPKFPHEMDALGKRHPKFPHERDHYRTPHLPKAGGDFLEGPPSLGTVDPLDLSKYPFLDQGLMGWLIGIANSTGRTLAEIWELYQSGELEEWLWSKAADIVEQTPIPGYIEERAAAGAKRVVSPALVAVLAIGGVVLLTAASKRRR